MRSTERPDAGRRGWLAAGAGWALAALGGPAAAAVGDGATVSAAANANARAAAARAAADRPVRLAAAWRGPRVDDPQQVGILEVAPDAARVRIATAVPVPSRAHGLTALPDGGFLAVAFRPGRWLQRFDADGGIVAAHRLDAGGLHFSGHVVTDAAAGVVHATATDLVSGEGWITVHDAQRLTLLDRRPSGGIEPHALLLGADGSLMVAHGGIRRNSDGRRAGGAVLAASLVRLDPRDGRRLAAWRLDDPSLSIRHLAWARADGATPDAPPPLGVALQAEHDDPAQRRDAPVLALLDGERLAVHAGSGGLGGVAGDIAPGAEGGFVLSQAAAGGAWWGGAGAGASAGAGAVGDIPADDDVLRVVARLREAGALATDDGGTWIAAAAGLARWHPARPPRLVPWPQPVAPDNHLTLLHPT